MTEKVVPVVRKIAPWASKIIKHVPLPGASMVGEAIEKYADPVLSGAERLGKLIPGRSS